ncbi:MAG TPA: NAD-dependent epimerase/dehydratase family protein [Solirubrobacteraceae bacterium]|nr:NAD-dependent epimerase/dehydratase family protein [Solirubrobacteraceae bacterium]
MKKRQSRRDAGATTSGETVLITGGAGFIGSHLGRRLLEQGHRVRALDSLLPQVHGRGRRPPYLEDDIELLVGDVRDREAVDAALDGVDAVVHLAARVGVGQSMYEIAEYSSVNTVGTAVLLEAMMDRPVRKLLVASSMSVYGEGLYRDERGRIVEAVERDRAQLESGRWEPQGPAGERLEPVATPETKQPCLSSIYALSKFDQERQCLLYGSAYGVPTVALRFFNAYGPDQALSNPYTGVLAIFAGRLLNDKPPLVYEDGHQRRDFVSVHDVARACLLALERSEADGKVLNVGSGRSVTVRDVAQRLAAVVGREHVEPQITGKYRVGDIRHCYADIELARTTIGYEPQVSLERGMQELAEWLEGRTADDRREDAERELSARGLTQWRVPP